MGMFWAALAASITNALGYQIFREPKEPGNGPLMAIYIFIFSLFLLLWSIRLYPQNIRKLGKLQFFIELIMAQFLMEALIIDFWFPLEAAVIKAFPKLAQCIEDMLSEGNWSCDTICDILKNETTGYAASYVLSCFFLLATLHATRAVDLRTLADGPGCFFKDIIHRVKLNKRRILRKLGFGPKKRVKINESNNNYCSGFSNGNDSTNGGCAPCNLSSGVVRKRRNSNRDNLEKKINKMDNKFKFCPVHRPKNDDSDYSDDFDMCSTIDD